MKIKWTQNWGLKIGSLVFAVIVWVLVTNINDPVVPQTYDNIPVKLVNTDLLRTSGLVYEILEGTDIINRVTVLAPRSVHSKISRENIVARADINDLSSLDTIGIKLSVNSTTDITKITGSSDIIKLSIEEEKVKNYPIQATTSGVISDGYILGDITTDQNVVRVTGPASIIDSIVKAEADTDVSRFTNDINMDADIRLYDAEGQQVISERITQNIKFVRVRIPILETKRLPVSLAVSGTPGAGYQATGEVKIEPASVMVAGKSSNIRNINSLVIPEGVLDISGATDNYVEEINLAQYLPDNLRFENPADTLATVTIYIEPEEQQVVTLRENRVRIVNMPEGYESSFTGIDEEVSVTLIGLASNLELVRPNDISGEIDIAKLMSDRGMEQISEGFYTVVVDLMLGEQITISEPIEVSLHITAVRD